MISYFSIKTKFNAADYYIRLEEIIRRKNRDDARELIARKNLLIGKKIRESKIFSSRTMQPSDKIILKRKFLSFTIHEENIDWYTHNDGNNIS